MNKLLAAASRRLSLTQALDLRFLPDEGLHYDEPIPNAWLDAILAELGKGATAFHAEGEGRAVLDVHPLQPVATRPPIRVRGDISAIVRTSCVRCLQPVDQNLVAKLDLTLFAEDKSEHVDEEADDNVGTYDKNEIDLPAVVREALLLEVAMSPSCEDEETCTRRTAAMLEEANRAAQSISNDDRWAALKELVSSTPGEPDQS